MKLDDLLSAIRNAVGQACDALFDKNIELLDKYFEEKKISDTEIVRIPKTVRMDYPTASENGEVSFKRIDVPLLSLIPITNTKIDKATFSVDCRLDEDKGEPVVTFPHKRFGETEHLCRLEITIVPDELPGGMSAIINGCNDVLQKQIDD